jgi:hypothetical protein
LAVKNRIAGLTPLFSFKTRSSFLHKHKTKPPLTRRASGEIFTGRSVRIQLVK